MLNTTDSSDDNGKQATVRGHTRLMAGVIYGAARARSLALVAPVAVK